MSCISLQILFGIAMQTGLHIWFDFLFTLFFMVINYYSLDILIKLQFSWIWILTSTLKSSGGSNAHVSATEFRPIVQIKT